MENSDLLKIIEDDIYIISFMVRKWSQEQLLKVNANDTMLKKMDNTISKSVVKDEDSTKSNVKPKKNDEKKQ